MFVSQSLKREIEALDTSHPEDADLLRDTMSEMLWDLFFRLFAVVAVVTDVASVDGVGVGVVVPIVSLFCCTLSLRRALMLCGCRRWYAVHLTTQQRPGASSPLDLEDVMTYTRGQFLRAVVSLPTPNAS